jgi:hypothetical protein
MDYQDLKKAVESKGYVFFDDKDFNLNIVFERTSDDFTDMFTDKCRIAYKENGIEKVLEI